MEEIQEASDSFLFTEVSVNTLVEKVKLFSQEVMKKNRFLVSAHTSLPKVDVILIEANWS